jgi:two-component system response regulator YesN
MVMDYAYNLCFKLYSNMANNTAESSSRVSEHDYKREIYEMVSIEGLREYILAVFKEAAALYGDQKPNTPENIVQSVKRYIQKNYSADISLELLSRKMFISPSYLSYLFKNVTGESYSDYLKNIRLTRARELLEQNNSLKVFEVCFMVGYKEYKYFSQQFKKAFGTNPTELRKATGRDNG